MEAARKGATVVATTHDESLAAQADAVHELELPASTESDRTVGDVSDGSESKAKRAWIRHSVRCVRQTVSISAVRHGENPQETPIP